MNETVAEVIADEVKSAGVDRVFGLPGGEVLALIDALRRREVEFVLCRHEANAGLTAAVYGKLKKVPGVVIATVGPGASNLLLPIANSLLDREPLVAFSAQVPDTWSTNRTHQRLPLLDVFDPVTKLARDVSPSNCRTLVREALQTALAEPAGPAYLTVSSDVALAPTADLTEGTDDLRRDAEPGVHGDGETAAKVLRGRLEQADRPVVAVGMGAHSEDSELLRSWVERWGLPVAVTPKVKGIVDETNPLFAGVISGMAIDRVMVEGLAGSDLIVGFGLDPAEIEGDWHEKLSVAWILDSPWATGVLPSTDLVACNHRQLLEKLLTQVPPKAWTDPFVTARAERQRLLDEPGADSGFLSPVGAVRALASALPDDTIVATDVGSHKFVFGQFWPSRRPNGFFMSNGLSGMGYGLPAAIGAKLARPEQPVLAVLGDGGFSMNCQELETARRVGATLLVVVIADRSYSLIRIGQIKRGLTPYGVDFEPIDSTLIAEACGVRGLRASSERELADCAADAIARNETTVVEVPIRADDYAAIV